MFIDVMTFTHYLWSLWSTPFSFLPYGDPYLAIVIPLLSAVVLSEMVARHKYSAIKRAYARHAKD